MSANMTPELQKIVAELRETAHAKHRLCRWAAGKKPETATKLEDITEWRAADMLEAQAVALKPFADTATLFERSRKYNPSDSTQISHRLGDFRAARAITTGEPTND